MKRTLSLLLAILLILSSLLGMVSCDLNRTDSEHDDDAAEENKENKLPKAPKGYKLYKNDVIQFAYPEDWQVTEGSVTVITPKDNSNTTNNIAINYDTLGDMYANMTSESYFEMVKPQYQAMGMHVTNVNLTKKVTNGINVIEITQHNTVLGIGMNQTQYIVSIGQKNYIVTITEVQPDKDLVNTVFSTLAIIEE